MPNKKTRELSLLRDLCNLDLPAALLIPSFLEALHGLIPSSRNLFDWCDANGQLTQYYIEGPVDTRIAALYFNEFHNRREAEVMRSFASALRSGASMHSAQELNTRSFFNSALYWEIWRPQGFQYRVEAIVRTPGGQPLGSLVLYRGPGERCFNAAEEALLPQVLPYLARLLEREGGEAPDAPALWLPSPDPQETLLLDAAGRLRHASAGALRLLLLAGQGLAAPQLCATDPAQDPTLQALRAELGGGARACRRVGSAWGLFEFIAQRLDALAPGEPAWTQVQIRRHEPRQLATERRLQALALSPGQTSVCRLLLQGCSQPEAARRLAVAPSTVADHTRKLYKTLGVRSLQELGQRLRPD